MAANVGRRREGFVADLFKKVGVEEDLPQPSEPGREGRQPLFHVGTVEIPLQVFNEQRYGTARAYLNIHRLNIIFGKAGKGLAITIIALLILGIGSPLLLRFGGLAVVNKSIGIPAELIIMTLSIVAIAAPILIASSAIRSMKPAMSDAAVKELCVTLKTGTLETCVKIPNESLHELENLQVIHSTDRASIQAFKSRWEARERHLNRAWQSFKQGMIPFLPHQS